MAKWRIVFLEEDPEEIEADRYSDTKDGKWIDFYNVGEMGGTTQVLRIRSDHVERIEKIS